MELMRRFVRGCIGSTRLYKMGATTLDFLSTVSKDGLGTWRYLREIQKGNGLDASPKSVALRNLKHPLLVRPGTVDVEVVINDIVREEYGRFAPAQSPQWMIDAGAYIGDTAAYFLSKYPNLKVIALEPNPPSHEMASQNLKLYGDRATLLKKGLFVEDGKQNFIGDGGGAAISKSGSEIECVSLPTLIEQYSIPHIDILKMDIEGAEESIFAANPEQWLKRTSLLIIEIHSSTIHTLVSRVLRENNFTMKPYRSVWYCTKKQESVP